MTNLFNDPNAPETEPPKIVAAMPVSEAAEAVEKDLVDCAGTKQPKAKNPVVAAAHISAP